MARASRPLLPRVHPPALSVVLLATGYLALGLVSLALWQTAPALDTMLGRHHIAGALANLALVLLGMSIVAGPYRRGDRWAHWVQWIPLLAYGVPILCIDGYHVGWRTESTAINAALLAPFVLGLLWDRRNRRI
ncbi:MAG: hypothetical protein E6K76_07195 [Candidatus Eisenbacteria bacterium]|uniref:Uncharacterized protein n=1 Tax=Eiseniibacteriota bacterium TaxID=2212470 RepID=A0A538T4W4_UNCEI|nr:MAG: hypothetical protein E6K76_07195 [Candidatus Eisenbacteria bacterium]